MGRTKENAKQNSIMNRTSRKTTDINSNNGILSSPRKIRFDPNL